MRHSLFFLSSSFGSVLLSCFLLALSTTVVVVRADISEECQQETAVLLEDQALLVVQSVVLEDYNASFYDRCQFGFSGVGCDISFEGDERHYSALCEAQGGQVYELPVTLSCAFGTVEHDLGFIPTCVGASCNVTLVTSGDVETEQVDRFLGNLTLTGCTADSGGASAFVFGLTFWAVSTVLFWLV